jgi:hypothetical protein
MCRQVFLHPPQRSGLRAVAAPPTCFLTATIVHDLVTALLSAGIYGDLALVSAILALEAVKGFDVCEVPCDITIT